MGQIHEIGKRMNITELAEAYGRKPDTLWRKAKKELPHPSGGKWSLYSELTEDEQRILLGNASAPRPAISAPAKPAPPKQIIRTDSTIPVHQPAPAVENTPAPGRAKIAWRTPLLIGLMVAPTAASVENMYSVTFSLSASAHSAIFLTAVLSVSALGFVVAGVRNWYTVGLAALLIAYESFCNLTRIYGGLMGNGHTGNPTRFLGTVTDIFGTGTHGTAIFLGAFTAFFIAAVQYAAVFELNKGK